jgi:transmembrane sensor
VRWPFLTRRERLRREAADWIARLNGPDAEADRAEFDRWYGSSPDHAAAYHRLTEIFHAAGRAQRPERVETPARVGRQRSRRVGYAFAAAAAGVALLAFFFLSARTASPVPDARQQVAAFFTEGEGRRIVLVDGSEVLLSPGSGLDVALGADERRLRLVRGEARFSVAHEARPFIVAADGTEVFARGTQFIVRVGGGRTSVALVEGSVDVSYSPDRAGERRHTRLRPGERLVVESGRPPSSAVAPAERAAVRSPPDSTRAMLEFDETPLREAVEQANLGSSPTVRIGDPSLAGLRISGAFRQGDTAGFARSVAAAFNLEVESAADGSLWLRPRR